MLDVKTPYRGTKTLRIVVEDLVVERGGRTVINGLSFAVESGEAVVLSGRNGAGKTTLIRALAGLIKPGRGTIRLDKADQSKTLGEQAHLIGHANAIKPHLTVRENISFWHEYLHPAERGAGVERALKHFGLSELAAFPAVYLSAGQKRRVTLARLLVTDMPVWLLDEPSVSLDKQSVEQLAGAVNGHTAKGGLVIAATHVPLGFERTRQIELQVPEAVL